LKYFEDLASKNKDSPNAQTVISNVIDDIKNKKADGSYLRCTVDILKKLGISLTTNLLTPEIQRLLNLI